VKRLKYGFNSSKKVFKIHFLIKNKLVLNNHILRILNRSFNQALNNPSNKMKFNRFYSNKLNLKVKRMKD